MLLLSLSTPKKKKKDLVLSVHPCGTTCRSLSLSIYVHTPLSLHLFLSRNLSTLKLHGRAKLKKYFFFGETHGVKLCEKKEKYDNGKSFFFGERGDGDSGVFFFKEGGERGGGDREKELSFPSFTLVEPWSEKSETGERERFFFFLCAVVVVSLVDVSMMRGAAAHGCFYGMRAAEKRKLCFLSTCIFFFLRN